jgi:drug/metabolite transporter, DME family
LLALGSALGYALLTIVSRRLAPQYHPLTPLTVGFAVGALTLLPALRLEVAPVTLSPTPWQAGDCCCTIGMRTTVATVASLVTLIEPLTAAGLAWLLFGERLGPLALVGAALLLGAVLMLTRE